MKRTYEEVRDLVETLGFRCTPQFAAPLMDDSREKILFGGWRASKTVRDCLDGMLHIMDWYGEFLQGTGKRRLIWLVGPDYKQTAEEYRYLSEWLSQLKILANPPSTANEGPRQLALTCNVVIETKSSDHPETLASVAPDLIIACEPGQMSDEVRDMLLGRSLEKNAPIIWGGTVENDEGHPTWAWYQETARLWLDNPTARHKAWSLPTWDNPLFYSCEAWVTEDPSLAQFCPDDNHGEAHGGRLHPVIHQFEVPAEQGGKGYDGFTFARRIAAIPTGVRYAVYPQVTERHLLTTIPQMATMGFFASAGGVDYGTTEDHPSALVVVQLTTDVRDSQVSFVGPRGIAWVRECITLNDGGDTFTLQKARKELADRYRCYRWNVDPRERFMAKNWEGEANSYSESAREARVGLLTARLNLNKLMFDMAGPGVSDLYEEMKRVHRRKTKDGQLKYVRMGDDRTAALEDAIEALDGQMNLHLASSFARPRTSRQRQNQREFARRV